MLHKIALLGLVVALACVLLTGVGSSPQSAEAYALADVFNYSCSGFVAMGTSNAPYVSVGVFLDEPPFTTLIPYGTVTAPVVDGRFVISVDFPEQPAGTLMYFEVFGNMTSSGDTWDFETFTAVSFAPCDQQTQLGAPIPGGFKQYNLTCDSAVYDQPAGEPVGDNVVLAGQAWHINPTPVMGGDGQNWSEIFVSGHNTGYIPTKCVGDLTPFN